MSNVAMPETQPLPPLREELKVERGAPLLSGAPSWLVFDPVRHKYFHLGQEAFELLANWGAGTVGALKDKVYADYGRRVSDEAIAHLINFLYRSNLTIAPMGNPVKAFVEYSDRLKKSFALGLIHRYLFIRVPLLRPSRFLAATEWISAPFFTRAWWWFVAITGVIGLFLMSRQWEEFFETFLHFISFEGALIYGASLIFIKTLHELGHAYAATRNGCRVPTMGIALIVLWPVLYTDTTDAWKLRDRKSRLMIDGAGVLVELALAAISLALWAFLDDGPARSVAFSVATIGLISSLVINLNPFMRFDGYYLFSDAIGVQNLQGRSFALGRWGVREFLWGIKAPKPELFPAGYNTLLIVYAWCTWIYRFFLFLGIALLVYTMFFKVLGIFLFVVEIIWFILRPIFNEMVAWWGLRSQIMKTRRTFITLTIFGILVALAAIPWRASVTVPAVIEVSTSAPIFSSEAGQITAANLAEGQPVEVGDLLLTLANPSMLHQQQQSERRIATLRERVRRGAMDRTWLAEARIAERELLAEQESYQAITDQITKLSVVAPTSGVLRDIDPSLKPGVWLPSEAALGYVVGDGKLQVKAYAPGEKLSRIDREGGAVFTPDDPTQPHVDVHIASIADIATNELPSPYLASQYGGDIATDAGDDGAMVTREAVYQVIAEEVEVSNQPIAGGWVNRGVLRMNAQPESLLSSIYRQAAQILIRELGV